MREDDDMKGGEGRLEDRIDPCEERGKRDGM
jgi:hypothetical protein